MLTSIIFDVGETLIDTTSWNRGLEEALFEHISGKYGIDRQRFETCYNTAMSEVRKVRDKGEHVDKVALGAEKIAEMLKFSDSAGHELEAFMKEFRLANLRLFDDAGPLLKELQKRYDLYVLSNARTESIGTFLDRFSIKGLFKQIFISQSFGTRKDEGGLFRVFLYNTSLNPKNCLMVGNDAIIDGKSMELGIPFCFVDRKGEASNHRYTFKIGDLGELNSVLKFFDHEIDRECRMCKATVRNRLVCEKCEKDFRHRVSKDPLLWGMLKDLSDFTGFTEADTVDKLVKGPLLVRDDWINAWPTTESEIRGFYSTNSNYLYDLTVANMQDDWIRQNAVIVGYAKAKDYDSILDFGCGIAQPLIELAESGKNVFGVDWSTPNREYVKRRFASRNIKVSISEEMEEREYDFVICTDVLEHSIDPPEIMRRFLNHIRKGGAVAFTVRLFREDDYLHPMHLAINKDKRGEIEEVLKSSGFARDEKVEAPRGLEIWVRNEV